MLRSNQLALYYQTQLKISKGKVIRVETLVRWGHHIQGLIGPDHFIGLAEQRGLIGELVIKQAVKINNGKNRVLR